MTNETIEATKEQLVIALQTILYQESPGHWYNSFIESCNVANELDPAVLKAMESYNSKS